MTELSTSIPELILTKPIPDRDALFALAWFTSESGKDTLLKMGNAPDQINEPNLKDEQARLKEFLILEGEGKQKTWMLRFENATIGAAWIDLIEKHGVKAPSIHLMIGDSSYRGKGFGGATMNRMIKYLKENRHTIIYSRHLVGNETIIALNRSLGFVPDGQSYIDTDGLTWQNVKLSLE